MKKLGLILGASLVMLAHPAIAEDRLIEGFKIIRACAGDVERLCSGITPGGGRIKACVKDKLTQMSPQCFDALVTAIAGNKEPPPDFAKAATVKRFDNLRGMRYCEVFLIGADLANESLSADFFNTTDLNNSN